MRTLLLTLAVLATAGCERSPLLAIDATQAGTTGARATGRYPDIQAVPGRAARQLDAGTNSDIAAELNAEADAAASLPRVNGPAADSRARGLVAEARADERRRRERIENRNRVAPLFTPHQVVFNREEADG